MTKRELLEMVEALPEDTASESLEKVADELEAWAAESDLDGFNLAYVVMPETFSDVVDHLIPELQRRGSFKKEYAAGTYREKLFGRGPRLEETHPAATRRRKSL